MYAFTSQMPVAVVIPTNGQKTATDRQQEEAQVVFPSTDDTGIEISDISIVIVFNGLHHFVGTKRPQPNFKDGIAEVIGHLQQARVICDNLRAEDKSVKSVVSTTAQTAATIAYNLERLFKPPAPVPESASGDQPAPKKARLLPLSDTQDEEVIAWKTSLTRDGQTSMTTLHCHCGLKAHNKAQLQQHKEDVHAGGNWACSYPECPTVCTGKYPEKSLRKHVRNMHLNEYLYWCKYCTDYGKDQRHLVINHMFTVHGMGQELPCRNFQCSKMFPSLHSLKEHEKYCSKGKQFTCHFCCRLYKRVKNMKAHIKALHLEDSSGKLLCTACGKSYESKTSYTAHYTNNQCIKMIIPGVVEDQNEEEDEEEEEEGDGEDPETAEFSEFS